MKISTLVTIACFGLAGVAGSAVAQTVIDEPTVTIGSTEPTAEAPAIARREAGAAWAQARQQCRRQADRDERQSCIADARRDYDDMMATAKSDSMNDSR